jgi:hypothetical protein
VTAPAQQNNGVAIITINDAPLNRMTLAFIRFLLVTQTDEYTGAVRLTKLANIASASATNINLWQREA